MNWTSHTRFHTIQLTVRGRREVRSLRDHLHPRNVFVVKDRKNSKREKNIMTEDTGTKSPEYREISPRNEIIKLTETCKKRKSHQY